MFSTNPKPKWWQLYMVLPLALVLFAGDGRLKISTAGHQIVQVGIVLLICSLTYRWVNANASALSRMDREERCRRVTIIQFPLSPLPEPDGQSGRILQLPDSEVKGVLGDTFEMDYIDPVPYRVEEMPQETKKE